MTEVGPGIKIFKPKKKSSTDQTSALTSLRNLSLSTYGEPEAKDTVLLRNALYKAHLEAFESKVNEYEQKQFLDLANDVITFVHTNAERIQRNTQCPTPIGVLFNGLSQDENKDLMDLVLTEVENFSFAFMDSVELRIARLTSAKCHNVKLAFQSICKQVIMRNTKVDWTTYGNSSISTATESESEEELDSEDDDEDGPSSSSKVRRKPKPKSSTKKSSKTIVFSVNDLKKWIAKCRDIQPVLIVIDDVDSIDKKVVTGILQLLRCCKLPTIYLFGIIHNFIPIDQFFSDLCGGSFRFERLYSVDPDERLENFIQKVAFDLTLPIRISGAQLRLMVDYYNYYQFSIKRLLQVYKLCLIDHFTRSESIFCTSDIQHMWNFEQMETIPEDFLRNLVSTSFPAVVSSPYKNPATPSKSPKKKSRPEELTVTEIREKCQDKLYHFNDTMVEWHAALRVAFAMGSELPEQPIGEKLSDLYIMAWDGTLFKEPGVSDQIISSPFEQFLKLVGHFSQIEMQTKLQRCVESVEEFIQANSDTKLVKRLEIPLIKQMNDFIHQLQSTNANTSDLNVSMDSRTLTKRTVKTKTLEDLKGSLLKKIQGEKSLYETTLKQDIIKFLRISIKNKLKKSINSLPFANVFIMDNANYMRSQLLPNLSKELHVALCLPGMYLRCNCCSSIPIDVNSQSLPDTCILYKLYLEQLTKNLNLNHLYHSFKSYFELTVRRKTYAASKKAMEKEQEFLHRFRQALIELQFLGFVKKTRKRADEATKLNWIFS